MTRSKRDANFRIPLL